MKKLTTKQRREIKALAGLPDARIDTSDTPEVTNWTAAQRGRFYRPGIAERIPIYLDPEVMQFLIERAEHRRIDTSTLANELLKKDVELIKAAGL